MADFNSKYTGEQVDALLDIVSQGGVGGGGGEGEVQKTTEAEITAMGFTKNLGTITEVKMNGESKGTSGVVDLGTVITEHQDISGKQDKITDLDAIRSGAEKGATALQSIPSEYVTESELNGKGYATTSALNEKVDKISGKQLSTEDFTTALKTKLEGLSNYNDAEISTAVSSLQTQLDTLVSGDANDAINSFNEIIAFLDGVKDTQDLSSIIASIEQQIAGKMDKVTLATVATTGSYNDLSNKPTIPSEQVNADWNATSGKAQILNKPTIPAAVTESTVSGWGFTKNTGTYSKPSGGIPKTDLASAVQTSLGKADTALQSYTEKYTGTITGIKMNGASKGTSGIVDLGTVITDISGKVDKVAGMGLSTYDFNDGWADKITESEEAIAKKYSKPSDGIPRTDLSQDVQNLLSKAGTSIQTTEFAGIQNIARVEGFESIQGNILYALPDTATGDEDDIIATANTLKTINGQSIVGSGDITVSAGGGGTITGVSANGTSIATSGVANIPAASTSAYGVTKLSSATNSTSTTLAATASAVKSAYDLANSYKGTVTGVKINGTTKSPTSGTVDLGTVITSHQDISGKQDKLVSGTNIKTINGTSILGSGNIEISGGSGGGEDIRYFTEFTVEDFIYGCEINGSITYDTTELFNAMKSNKVICVPYRGYDKGFIIASYKSGEDEEYPSMYLQKGDVEYFAWTGDSYELVGEYPIYNSVQLVEVAGGEVFLEILDNRIYKITDPVDYLHTFFHDIQKGTTIHFMSGESGTAMEMYNVFWANGEIPQIDPNTHYELSVMQNAFGNYNMVLTPFKPVES